MGVTGSILSVVNGYHLRPPKEHAYLRCHPACVTTGHRLDLKLGHVRRAVVIDAHAPVPLAVVGVPRDFPVNLDVAVVGVHDLLDTTDRVRAVEVRALPAQPVALVGSRSVNAHVRKPATC